jgi:hypothetical protein
MIVKFRRNWFGPNGVQYKTSEGPNDVPDQYRDQLPSDAVVLTEKSIAFDTGKPKLPGFGAKPMHEQVLDEIPNAAPTHMITEAGTGQTGPTPPRELTPEAEKNLSTAAKKARADQQRQVAEAEKHEKADAEAGLKRAEQKAELVKEQKIEL